MNTTANTTVEKFTPGPWQLSPNKTYVRSGRIHGWNIANIVDQEPYTEANAKLIAAAPEMYEALIKATKWLQAQRVLTDAAEETGAIELYRTIAAAIKKATE